MRPLAALVAGNAAVALLLAATWGSPLGRGRWDDEVAYVALVAAALACAPLLRRRRSTTLVMASAGAWSAATGALLVYVTPWTGGGRAATWWHGATSVAFALAFLAHWARNQPRLATLARRLAERRAPLAAAVGAWAALALLALASWRTPLGAAFTDEHFARLSTAAFGLTAALGLYGALILTSRRVRPRLRDAAFRSRLRGAVDASLLAATWLVALTGFPLAWAVRALRAADAYWLVASWHVITGALLLGLVACHAGLNARPLRAHAGLVPRG